VAYTFTQTPRVISSLSLALGIAVMGTLADVGVVGAGLKWPNDIMTTAGKLGGILAETKATCAGSPAVVAGIGINLDLQGSLDDLRAAGCDDNIADLNGCLERAVSTIGVTTKLIESMINALLLFEARGFAAFRSQWADFDWLYGKEISVETPAGCINGNAAGIGEDGALLVQTLNGLQRVTSGRVTIVQQEGIVA
jgi:BirA family biotin operon repressor/biotin-[acetyl-CoA-carboxylase] ligase